MRSLQRIQHTRHREGDAADQPGTIHQLDRRTVRRREGWLWLRRARRLALFGGALAALAGGFIIATGSRIVADGMVRANVAHVTAPAKMRVAAWHVGVGATVRPGDPIVSLTPVERDSDRVVVAARHAAARAKLAWFDAGGETEVLGAERRIDRVVEAERNEALERAALVELRAALDVRREAVGLAGAALEEVRVLTGGESAELEARRRTAVADVARTKVEFDQANRDAERTRQLGHDGIQSRRAVEAAAAKRDGARAALDSLEAVVLRIEVETANARRANAVAETRAGHAVAVAEAAERQAWAAVAAAEARAEAWAVEAAHHRAYAIDQSTDAGALRAARRDQLAADLMVAEAALTAHDSRVGPRVVTAQTDGVVDELLEVEGAVVEKGTLLLRHRDTADARVVAYVSPATAADLVEGATCSVRCAAEGTAAAATVIAIGGVWLQGSDFPTAAAHGPRIAVTLALDGEVPFRAGARVQAVFHSDAWTAARRRALDWFSR